MALCLIVNLPSLASDDTRTVMAALVAATHVFES